MNDSTRRVIRGLLQLVAGGGLAALFMQIAKDVPDSYAPYVVMGSAALAMVAQIVVEELTGKDIGVKRTAPNAVN
jgi:hypothetical protein